jgi:hypothetical protein
MDFLVKVSVKSRLPQPDHVGPVGLTLLFFSVVGWGVWGRWTLCAHGWR